MEERQKNKNEGSKEEKGEESKRNTIGKERMSEIKRTE
jgi:hypothetical protein